MANIYVRKSGSDSNDGSTPALAKLTIAGAISAMNSDDIIWIGAGIYREQNLVSGTKNVAIYGDITGEHTGDAGEVIWSGLNADDDTYTDCNGAIDSNSDGYSIDIQNILFQNFRLNNNRGVIHKANWGDITIKDVYFDNIYRASAGNIYAIYYVHSTVDTTETITIEEVYCKNLYNCSSSSFAYGLRINTNSTSENNLKLKNVKFDVLFGNSQALGIYITFQGTIIDKIENLEVVNIFCQGGNSTGIKIESNTPKDLYNCIAQRIYGGGGSAGMSLPLSSYFYNCSVVLSGTLYAYPYQGGTQSNCVNKANYYITKIDDISRFSPLKGVGNTSFPTTDIKGNPRPAYGNGTACDIGALESTADIIQREATIKDSGDYSIKVAPCNYFKKVFQIPVTASELRTVKVKIRIDGTWGTYLPRVSLSGQGMTLSTATKNATTGSFEELTVSGTPTTNGIALLTIEAHSASTDAVFYIDTITIE